MSVRVLLIRQGELYFKVVRRLLFEDCPGPYKYPLGTAYASAKPPYLYPACILHWLNPSNYAQHSAHKAHKRKALALSCVLKGDHPVH